MAKVLMVQGTMSNVGKSFLVAALCRIFHQDGYSVAPFKSQNMALNSFITKDGLEMGRAQVVQAEAAEIEPTVQMNPILLKPTDDVGSQVIVNGEVVGNMRASEYFKFKHSLKPQIMEAYHSLANKYEIIVVEGAGSPAEINLRSEDIVNMGLAQMLDSPVLLVGDIDRGGVFASLYGTLALLTPEEQKRVKGLVINKFRGDVDILRPGLDQLADLTKVPVLGVVPMLHVDIDDEDSLAPRLEATSEGVNLLDVVVVRLPHISNFTDFNTLQRQPGVTVRYVADASVFGDPDLVIIPGTKSTMADLLWMRGNGLESVVRKVAAKGTPIIGICGGYQMLGETLEDPDALEHVGSLRGIGLLPLSTRFEPQKVRTRVEGTINVHTGLFHRLSNGSFSGYEIHMGRTTPCPGPQATKELRWFSQLTLQTGETKVDGSVLGNVLGTYVHGLFDDSSLAHKLVTILAERKGIELISESLVSVEEYKRLQYDSLAASVRTSLDIEAIYGIIGLPGTKNK